MKLKQEDRKQLVERMQVERLHLGLSYSEIARKSGVSQGQVSRICRGKFITKSYNVMQICKALNIVDESDHSDHRSRLIKAVMQIWDGTPADAEKITRLLQAVRDVRQGEGGQGARREAG